MLIFPASYLTLPVNPTLHPGRLQPPGKLRGVPTPYKADRVLQSLTYLNIAFFKKISIRSIRILQQLIPLGDKIIGRENP